MVKIPGKNCFMNKQISITVTFLLIFLLAGAQDLKLDEILSRHYKAMGLENLQKVNTITMTGSMIQNDAMPVKIIRMRPENYLVESDVTDITAYQGYDGHTAWWTTPWLGNPKPQLMPEDRAKDLRSKADFDGLLYNWKAKGHLVEFAGLDTIEKSLAYKLKVTKKDGSVEFLSIDTKTFLLVKRMYNRTVRGKDVVMEIFFRDYKAIRGIMFAYTVDTHYGGQPYNSMQLDAIELDQLVDAKRFTMPSLR